MFELGNVPQAELNVALAVLCQHSQRILHQETIHPDVLDSSDFTSDSSDENEENININIINI